MKDVGALMRILWHRRSWIAVLILLLGIEGAQLLRMRSLMSVLQAAVSDPEAASRQPGVLPDWTTRVERAVREMGARRATQAIPLLIELLHHQEIDVRSCAAAALGEMGREEAIGPLVNVLEDSQPHTYRSRRLAASSLWRLTGEYLGMDAQAWRNWLAERGKGPA